MFHSLKHLFTHLLVSYVITMAKLFISNNNNDDVDDERRWITNEIKKIIIIKDDWKYNIHIFFRLIIKSKSCDVRITIIQKCEGNIESDSLSCAAV